MDHLKKLIQIAGRENVFVNEPMKAHTSFRIGGAADYFAAPKSIEALEGLVDYCRESGLPYFILGNGTNLLVSDAGVRGVVIQLQKNLGSCQIEGETITAGAGILLAKLASCALSEELTGLEFASGIPGTLGGALVMNAGAYGGEIKDILVEAVVYKPGIGVERVPAQELQLGYRTSLFQKNDWIVLEAVLKLKKGDKAVISARMDELRASRTQKQPLELPSAGSAFKRPEGYFAGKLIQDAGLSGYRVGDAAVSEKHCGFIVNKGNATAQQMQQLFAEVADIVEGKFGVRLEPEVRFLGEF